MLSHEEVSIRLATATGTLIAETTERFVAPVAFPDLPSDFNAPVVERARAAGLQTSREFPSLTVRGEANIRVEEISSDRRVLHPSAEPLAFGIGSGDRRELWPGRYGVSVTGLDGRRSDSIVALELGEALVLNVLGPSSPHEFLIGPAEAGVLSPDAKRDDGTPGAEPFFRFRHRRI